MIYEDEILYIEYEKAQIPWVKIFTKSACKEISQLSSLQRKHLFDVALECEKAMIEFYKPDKINWASFANYVPRVHIHIQARFKDDSFFPESMWGVKQRDASDKQLNLEEFTKFLNKKLKDVKLHN